jgi:hypothetical protein
MALDFKRLMDPEVRAQRRREEEEEAARRETHERRLRRDLDVCLLGYEGLSQKERGLVSSCQLRINQGLSLSKPQETWFFDIAASARRELDRRIAPLVAQHANGDPLGEHPAFRRCDWPDAKDPRVDRGDYWYWALHMVEMLGVENGRRLRDDSPSPDM